MSRGKSILTLELAESVEEENIDSASELGSRPPKQGSSESSLGETES